MLRPGMLIDKRFKILKVIGRGGTSCVYLAEHIRLHNFWAIKEVFREKIAGIGDSTEALIAESDILTKLNHPGLPKIIDIMNTPQSFLIVMEYIEGVSLDKILQEKGVVPQDDVLKWGKQLCDVLGYLHSQQPSIIYRDMKPANIMLKPNGDVVLIDFGMAREYKVTHNHDTTNLGTHGYAAPEQYKLNAQTDARTDIYSLGVTLYHLVTGCDPCLPPYGIRPICSINPSLSPRLESIIRRCTQIEAANRYQSVGELSAEIEGVINNTQQLIPWDESSKTKRSKKPIWLFVLIPILVVALIGIAAAITLSTSTGPYNNGEYNFGNNYYSDYEVNINYADERQNITFVCQKSGYYRIETDSDDDILPVLWLMDSSGNELGGDNTNGVYDESVISHYLMAGEVYMIQATIYDLDPAYESIGRYWVSIYME